LVFFSLRCSPEIGRPTRSTFPPPLCARNPLGTAPFSFLSCSLFRRPRVSSERMTFSSFFVHPPRDSAFFVTTRADSAYFSQLAPCFLSFIQPRLRIFAALERSFFLNTPSPLRLCAITVPLLCSGHSSQAQNFCALRPLPPAWFPPFPFLSMGVGGKRLSYLAEGFVYTPLFFLLSSSLAPTPVTRSAENRLSGTPRSGNAFYYAQP